MARGAVVLAKGDAGPEFIVLTEPEAEENHPTLGTIREGLERVGGVALVVLVIGRIARERRALEGGDGLGDAVERDIRPEDLLELLAVTRDRLEPFDHFFVR